VHLGDRDLSKCLRRPDLGSQLVEDDAGHVLDQAEHVHAGAGHARADFHPVPDRPESEQADAVLPG